MLDLTPPLATHLSGESVNDGRQLSRDDMLDEIPHANRRAFSDWVERIAKVVAHKDLLQVATLIRNRFVHSPPADWDLSRSKK